MLILSHINYTICSKHPKMLSQNIEDSCPGELFRSTADLAFETWFCSVKLLWFAGWFFLQCNLVSNSSAQWNNYENWLKHTTLLALFPLSASAGIGCVLRVFLSKKLPYEHDAAGLAPTLWEPLIRLILNKMYIIIF